jgi:hypothetical protein
MNGLLREVLAAHGGIDQWKRYGKISATIVSGGDLFDAKGLKPDMTPRKVSTATKVERMIVTPFGNPNWKMTFVPDRVVIEDGNGAVVAERSNPRNGFAGHSYETPWDPVHRAYFSGYALWTYLNTPFFLAMQGFEVEEVAPWIEGNDTWRVLRAKFPANIASHSSNQDFYFGPDFLLRRHDYQVDIAGSFPAAQYVYDLQEFAGFWFPTKRRAHPRNADLTAEKHRTYVWIDVAEVAVGEED